MCFEQILLPKSEYILFLNPAFSPASDTQEGIQKAIEKNPGAGAYVCRNLPYEQETYIDPVTLAVYDLGIGGFVCHKEKFEQIGGFDEKLIPYGAEIVALDLARRLISRGYPLYYAPEAVVICAHEPEDTLENYKNRLLGHLLLTYKFGTFSEIIKANAEFLKTIKNPRHFDGVRKCLTKSYLRHFVQAIPLLRKRENIQDFTAKHTVQLHMPPRGKFALPDRIKNGPCIGIIIRTVARPEILREALASLANQTYRNFQIVVVEDGINTSQEMIESEFPHLPILYHATGEKKGRGRAGNIGLSLAQTDYLSFLDDDDLLFPDHLEVMAARALQTPEADMILGTAMVMRVDNPATPEGRKNIREIHSMHFDRLDIFTMCQSCQIPIQSAMFKRELFLKLGGLREDIDAHEDWAMWLKYLAVAKRADPKQVDIHRATSIFVQEADPAAQEERLAYYHQFNSQFFNDPEIRFTVTLADMRGYYDGMIADFQHVYHTGQAEEYFKSIASHSASGAHRRRN